MSDTSVELDRDVPFGHRETLPPRPRSTHWLGEERTFGDVPYRLVGMHQCKCDPRAKEHPRLLLWERVEV